MLFLAYGIELEFLGVFGGELQDSQFVAFRRNAESNAVHFDVRHERDNDFSADFSEFAFNLGNEFTDAGSSSIFILKPRLRDWMTAPPRTRMKLPKDSLASVTRENTSTLVSDADVITDLA